MRKWSTSGVRSSEERLLRSRDDQVQLPKEAESEHALGKTVLGGLVDQLQSKGLVLGIPGSEVTGMPGKGSRVESAF